MKTRNNTILITGGSSGIGLALTQAFHQLGNQIIVVGRDPAKLERLQGKLPDVCVYALDLTNPLDRDDLIMSLERNHPDLNVLINNAAIQQNYSDAKELCSVQQIEPELTLNLLAPMELVSLTLPILLQQSEAAIINVSSALAFCPKRSAPVYCASKAGLHSYTKSLRYQLENTPVKVMELIPSLVETAMTSERNGKKIPVDTVVRALIAGITRDQTEINIGKTRLLRAIQRLSPRLADSLVKHSN